MSEQRRLAFTNRKGGCGKTTTTVNVAAALAHLGHSVLVIDTDPQAHATMSLGISQDGLRADLTAVVLGSAHPREAVRDTYVPRLKVIGATRRLADFERRYANSTEARSWMSARLAPIMDRFDFTVFDTPPTTQLLTLGALVAAREAYIPMQGHFLAMEGMIEILELVERIRRHDNSSLRVCGIIPTFFEPEVASSRDLLADLAGRLGEELVMPAIRHNHALAEAPGEGRTIFQHDLHSSGALDYYRVARRIRAGQCPSE